ncbi:uncharacterized abhydrolase domain-containing protein DDB_G0269086-like [Achroia grisella]|uniref:uncharacterized abhydrolase domain-containing protein DDB_G0269086-like n=1 Tax=Achroia grisella TaxID=688607 RepID=UPI0027D2FC65|nr:uncharacterized abhydrolase domain-containing protein DDB_G0269086-like [Achroia grisella]
MGISTEFENFEQQFLEIIGEFQSISDSESRLREALRTESTKAEAAEVAREAAERAAAEARSAAVAATAGASQAAATLAKAQDEITGLKIQVELIERQRTLLEERYAAFSGQIALLERELQQLRPLQVSHSTLLRQYTELQERVRITTEDTRNEASRLENDLRRVEKCAAGGSELRERARLAAAAHAREKRLSAAELQHTSRDLVAANSEIVRLGAHVAELQLRLSEHTNKTDSKMKILDHDAEAISEIRAALEAERAGAARLERALASALSDNATLAARLHDNDNTPSQSSQTSKPVESSNPTHFCPIDAFLAD